MNFEEFEDALFEDVLYEDDFLGWLADEQHEAMMLED